MDKTNNNIVWSSDDEQKSSNKRHTKMQNRSNRIKNTKLSSSKLPQDPGDGIIRIHRTSHGKGNSSSTIIIGVSGTNENLDKILSDLKKQLGAGGYRELSTLIIQGNHREKVLSYFEKKGNQVKIAGG
jgi:translation initiation factor 1